MNLSNHKKAVLALIIANFIWGAASPIFKWSFSNIEPFTLAFLRFSLASLILLPFVIKKLKIRKEHWKQLLLLSFCGITLNISFFFLGLKIAPAINAPIIATAGPIFLLIGCSFFLREKIKSKIIIGTLIGFAGVILIILEPIIEHGFDASVLGNLFFVVATICGVCYTIITKKIAQYYAPITLVFWSFLIGSVTFIPPFIFEVNKYGFLTNLKLPGITGIIVGVFLSSALAFFCYHWAIKNLFAQEVGIFAYLDPVIAIIIAMPLLGEYPTPIYLLGAFAVFGGIFIAEGRIPYHPFHKWNENHDS